MGISSKLSTLGAPKNHNFGGDLSKPMQKGICGSNLREFVKNWDRWSVDAFI